MWCATRIFIVTEWLHNSHRMKEKKKKKLVYIFNPVCREQYNASIQFVENMKLHFDVFQIEQKKWSKQKSILILRQMISGDNIHLGPSSRAFQKMLNEK